MMVEALTRAVQRYKSDYETRIGVAQPVSAPAATTTPSHAPATVPPASTSTAPAATTPAQPQTGTDR